MMSAPCVASVTATSASVVSPGLPATLQQPAYVLHARAYRETSAIVEFFTREHGRFAVVANGMRRPKSTWRALLQPFRALLISWRGRGAMPTLREAEANGPGWQLTGAGLASGFYLNELVVRLVPQYDPHPALFQCYDQTLHGLSRAMTQEADTALSVIEVQLRRFEKRLLESLGYGLILDHEGDTGAALENERCYAYHLQQGPILQSDPLGQSSVIVHGDTLKALNAETFSSARQLKEAKLLMRLVINAYLGGKPLHSRELMKKKVL